MLLRYEHRFHKYCRHMDLNVILPLLISPLMPLCVMLLCANCNFLLMDCYFPQNSVLNYSATVTISKLHPLYCLCLSVCVCSVGEWIVFHELIVIVSLLFIILLSLLSSSLSLSL